MEEPILPLSIIALPVFPLVDTMSFDPIFKPAERDDKVILVSAPSEDQNQDDPASSEPFVVFDLNLSNSDEV